MTPTPPPDDFEGLAKHLSESGVQAAAPAFVLGRSGAKHEFALAIGAPGGKPKVLVDAALSLKEVEEIKVLSFYAKVFDLSPEHALLCVSPRLGPRGRQMAKEYNISVLENEVPKMLVPMAADYVNGILGRRSKK